MVELMPREDEARSGSLTRVAALAGDRRTGHLIAATVRGIVAAESLVCARIAAFSPPPGHRPA